MVKVSGFARLVCYFSRQIMKQYAHVCILVLIAKLNNYEIYYFTNLPSFIVDLGSNFFQIKLKNFMVFLKLKFWFSFTNVITRTFGTTNYITEIGGYDQ